ncbi:MAG: polymer-forming cytoskeletal protein, partial [Lysobacteraceae bacterium]
MSFPSFFAVLFAGDPLRSGAPARRLAALAFLLAGLLGCAFAQAAVYTFNGLPVDSCTLQGNLYTCPYPAYLEATDSVVIGSAYTLKVTNNVTVTYNQGLTMAAGAKLIVTGNLNIKGINPANLKVTGGGSIEVGGHFSMGDLRQTLSADISAASMHLGTDAITINGNLNSKGAIAIGSYARINGNVSATVVTTGSPVSISGNVTATQSLSLASGSTVGGDVDTGSLVLESSEALI